MRIFNLNRFDKSRKKLETKDKFRYFVADCDQKECKFGFIENDQIILYRSELN